METKRRGIKRQTAAAALQCRTHVHTHTRTQIDASESHHSERRLSITLFELIRLAQNRRDRWMERWNRAEQVSVVLFLSCKSKSIAFLLTLIVRVCCIQYIEGYTTRQYYKLYIYIYIAICNCDIGRKAFARENRRTIEVQTNWGDDRPQRSLLSINGLQHPIYA